MHRLSFRKAAWATIGLGLVTALVFGIVALTGQPAAADGSHEASDFFIFAKAAHGDHREPGPDFTVCDGSNNSQSEVSGSNIPPEDSQLTSGIFGRVHSNADHATSGAGIVFDDPVTYGTFDGTNCSIQAEADQNIYPATFPAVDAAPSGVDGGGWPGNLSDWLEGNGLTFTAGTVGITCDADVGTLEPTTLGNSDLVIDPTPSGPHDNKVVCRNTGKITLNISDVGPFKITMISHGQINISGQNVTVAPADTGHNVLAWTDIDSLSNPTGLKANPGITLAGSNFDVDQLAILFTPRSGQDISGSNDSELCIQSIGDGRMKLAGSNSVFGPGLCGVPSDVETVIHTENGAHDVLAGPPFVVEVGTKLHDRVVVSSNTTFDLTGTITLKQFDNGDCSPDGEVTATWTADGDSLGPTGGTYAPALSVTIDPALPFTPAVGVYSYQASYGEDPNNEAATSVCEGPIHVVDAVVSINPPTGTNLVSTNHDLTITVTVSGGDVASPGASVDAGIDSGPGEFVPADPVGDKCTTGSTAGAGSPSESCDVTIHSSDAGTTVVSAIASIPIDVDGDDSADITVSRSTDGLEGNSIPAEKDWVDAKIEITPGTEVNEIGTNHELTATVTVSGGNIAGTGADTPLCISFSLTNSGASATFVDPGNADTNDCDGAGGDDNDCTISGAGTADTSDSCTVKISSSTPGTTDISASADIPVDSTGDNATDTSVSRSTDGSTTPSGLKNSDPAEKTWIAFKLLIITCTMDDDLVASKVTLDTTDTETIIDTDVAALAVALSLTTDELEAILCNLDGAQYDNLPSGPQEPDVDVNNPIP